MQRQIDRTHRLRPQALDLHQSPRARCGAGRKKLAGRAADDVMHEVRRTDLRHRPGVAHLSVAQHRDPVGEAEDLVEPVGDIDDAQPLAAQPAQTLVQPRHVGLRQRRRRLVEYDDARRHRQRPGNGDHRRLGGR